MSKYIRHFATPLVLSAALILGACGDRDGGDADTGLATDTGLANDLALAGQDTASPQLRDVPADQPATATQPRTTTPRRTGTTGTATRRTTTRTTNTPNRTESGNIEERGTRGSEGAIGTLPAGTRINLASTAKVCTNTHKVGDKFTATVSEAVTANGVTIPAGATAVVTITKLDRSDRAGDEIDMGFTISSIRYGGQTYPISSRVVTASVEKVRSTSKSSDAQKVIGGAVIGAVAGQVLGKDTKSTVTGAAAGAAAGTAAAIASANYEGCINQGGRIAIELTQPAQLRAE